MRDEGDVQKLRRSPDSRGTQRWWTRRRLTEPADNHRNDPVGHDLRTAPVPIFELATAENLEPSGYAFANPDLQTAFGDDSKALRKHFNEFGIHEGRRQLARQTLERVERYRREKLERLALDVPTYEAHILGMVLRMALARDSRLPLSAVPISDHEYDGQCAGLVDSSPDGLFLDLGAGFRPTYRRNVVNVEIAAFPTTDVIAFADELPFESATFDGGVCLAVLEHVPDPWRAAAELVRVTKLGGTLLVDWPFLQPVHGYPHHYFNATEQAARETFEKLGAQVVTSIPPFLHPIFTLRWILDEWQRGLEPADREAFTRLTVSGILDRTEEQHLEAPWATHLPEDVQRTISAGTRLVVTKR